MRSYYIQCIILPIVGILGILGNTAFIIHLGKKLRGRPRFYQLMVFLAIDDLLLITSFLCTWSLPVLLDSSRELHEWYYVIWTFPFLHIFITANLQITAALSVDRYLSICEPLFYHAHSWSMRFVAFSIMSLSIIYNVPKFLELKWTTETKIVNETHITRDIIGTANVTLSLNPIGTPVTELVHSTNTPRNMIMHIETEDHSNSSELSTTAMVNETSIIQEFIGPTELRTNPYYIEIYILWCDLVIQGIIPFLVLLTLNILTVKEIRKCKGKARGDMQEEQKRQVQVHMAEINVILATIFILAYSVRYIPTICELIWVSSILNKKLYIYTDVVFKVMVITKHIEDTFFLIML